jgi:hypothetical protein
MTGKCIAQESAGRVLRTEYRTYMRADEHVRAEFDRPYRKRIPKLDLVEDRDLVF